MKNKLNISLLVLAIVATMAMTAFGEDKGSAGSAGDKGSAGSAGEQAMPPMGRPAEMDQLSWMKGKWSGVLDMRMDPTSEYTKETMNISVSESLDGCVMISDVTTKWAGMPFAGHGMVAYDREKKAWTQVWIDNMAANFQPSQGTLEGKTLTLWGGGTMGGMPYKSKDVSVKVSDTEYTWAMDMSYDDGKTWFNVMKGTFKKQ